VAASYYTPRGEPDDREVKLTVVVSSRQYLELERQARLKNTSVTRAVRQALDLGLVMQDAQARGGRVLVQESDGKLRQIEMEQ